MPTSSDHKPAANSSSSKPGFAFRRLYDGMHRSSTRRITKALQSETELQVIAENPNSADPPDDPQGIFHDLCRQHQAIKQMGQCIDRLADSIDKAILDHDRVHHADSAEPSHEASSSSSQRREGE